MNSDEQDAIKALAYRLTEWGVDGAADKAKLYVTDLVNHGWAMQANRSTGRRPPPAGSDEECRAHIGEWRVNCRCCIAERAGAADEEQQMRRMTQDEARAMAREGARGAARHEETA